MEEEIAGSVQEASADSDLLSPAILDNYQSLLQEYLRAILRDLVQDDCSLFCVIKRVTARLFSKSKTVSLVYDKFLCAFHILSPYFRETSPFQSSVTESRTNP